jgi:hypothetical protein
LRVKAAPLVKKQKIGLHLLLVAVIFFYLYSPLLDHWLGVESYTRPHTHLYFSTNILTEIPDQSEIHWENHSEGHQEGVLCFLDINALLSIALYVTITLDWFLDFAHNSSFVFNHWVPYFLAASIYLSSLDPPPRI